MSLRILFNTHSQNEFWFKHTDCSYVWNDQKMLNLSPVIRDHRMHLLQIISSSTFREYYLFVSLFASNSLRADMYVWAICNVSNLLSLCSASKLGMTSLSLSKASFSPFILLLSLALAANLLFFMTEGDVGRSLTTFFLRP